MQSAKYRLALNGVYFNHALTLFSSKTNYFCNNDLNLKKILTLEWRTVNRITRHGGQLSLAWLAAQYWDERHFQRATVQTQYTENQCPETSNQHTKQRKTLPYKRNSEIYVLRHRIKQKIEVRRAMPERNHFFLQEMFPYWLRKIFSEMYWVISFSAMC